jgi:hypothetical protein
MVFVPLIFAFGVLALCFISRDSFDGVMFFLAKFFFVFFTILACVALMFGIIALPWFLGLTGAPAVALIGFMLLVLVSGAIASLP